MSKQLDALLDKRQPVLKEVKEPLTLREGAELDVRYYFVPIISDSNQIGDVLAFAEGPEWPEATANVLNIFVHFLKMQLEI
jgi:AbrB family transcriptional regulator (stage V sporulation protein T)